MRAFEYAVRQNWAILAERGPDGVVRSAALKQILDIAARRHEPDFEAVAQKLGERVNGSDLLEMRGSVAVLHVIGPIFRYANLFTAISGATSVEELALAFRAAVDNPNVSAVVLNIDSPGGEVAGISELASAIYDARSKKKVVAYADDLTASGAYWLASAASRIVASATAELGSIGVVGTLWEEAPPEGVTEYEFVSSVSPKKRPDLTTEEGKASVQQRIDDLAAVFVAAVARNRKTTPAKVASDFGEGSVLIASKAVAAGMADEVGTFESLISELSGNAAGGSMPAIGVHHTDTSDGSWDGPANEARLPGEEGPLTAAHAWYEAGADRSVKASYKFIHHEVAEDGTVGAANMTACSTGIGVLNGGRGGADIPEGDREGVHAHLAAHLKDGGKEAPALAGSGGQGPGSGETAQTSASGAGAAGAAAFEDLQAASAAVAAARAELDAQVRAATEAGFAAAAEIVALCGAADRMDLAEGLLQDRKTVEAARVEIQRARADRDAQTATISRMLSETGAAAQWPGQGASAAAVKDSPIVKAAEKASEEFAARRKG